MAEPFSLVELPLVGGIDQHTDSRKVAPAALLRAENCQILKTGRFDKRFGTTAITTTMMVGTAMASSNTTLAARGHELLVTERSRLLGRAPEKDRLVNLDALPEWTAREIPVVQSGEAVTEPDIAAISGSSDYVCITYVTGTAVNAIVKDAASDTVLAVTQLVATGYSPRVLAVGNVFVCVWNDGAGNIKGRRVDMSAAGTPTWDSAVTLRNDALSATTTAFDICNNAGTTSWALAYQDNTASPNITVKIYTYDTTASLAQVASGTTGETLAYNLRSLGIAYHADFTYYVIAYTGRDATPNDKCRACYQNGTTLANAVAPFQVATQASASTLTFDRVTVAKYTSNAVQIAFNARANTGSVRRTDDLVWSEEFNGVGTSLSVSKKMYGASLASKLLSANGTTYAILCVSASGNHTTTSVAGEVLDHNIVMCEIADGVISTAQGRPVCTITPRVGSGEIHSGYHSAAFVADPSNANSYLSVYGILSTSLAPTATTTPLFYRAMSCRVTLESGARQSCELGQLTYFSGGVPCWYDGVRVGEVGFLMQPHVTLTPSNGAGSLDNNGVYQYAIVQCQYDAAGNVHRGIPFKATVTNGAADDTMTVDIPYFGCTVRQDAVNNFGPPSFEIYRTEGGGPQLRLIAELQANSYSSASLTYTDLFGDADLASQRFLYDTATPDGRSQLAHVNPPSATLCMTHRDRVWFAGCPNRKEIWVSSKYVPGEAPFFSEAFRIIVDDGGDITAIASMDDKAIIFKDDRIFMVTGDGPDDAGGNSDWSPPTRILSTVGCIEPRSVAVTPIGILFQSRVGLSLLTRDLQVVAQWGRPVEDTLSGRTIVGAYAHKTLTEIRVLLDNGYELRYDYGVPGGAWLLATGMLTQSARYVVSTLFYLGTSGIRYEDSTLFTDASSYVSMLLELAPVSVGGRLGYQNVTDVLALFDHYTAHELLIELSADVDSYAESYQWTAAALTALSASEYVLEYKPRRAGRSRITKVRISDLTPTSGSVGTGRGYGLAAVTLKVADRATKYTLLGSTQKG